MALNTLNTGLDFENGRTQSRHSILGYNARWAFGFDNLGLEWQDLKDSAERQRQQGLIDAHEPQLAAQARLEDAMALGDQQAIDAARSDSNLHASEDAMQHADNLVANHVRIFNRNDIELEEALENVEDVRDRLGDDQGLQLPTACDHKVFIKTTFAARVDPRKASVLTILEMSMPRVPNTAVDCQDCCC